MTDDDFNALRAYGFYLDGMHYRDISERRWEKHIETHPYLLCLYPPKFNGHGGWELWLQGSGRLATGAPDESPVALYVRWQLAGYQP
jgi:hypothetical protein